MTHQLFDQELRALRRDRAFRTGPALFLHERTFDDIIDRLTLVTRRFRSAALIGCFDPKWPDLLRPLADAVQVFDPGPLLARAANGTAAEEDQIRLDVGSIDLCVAIGTLDTVNELPAALRRIRTALASDSLLIGAISGGDTLPRLRSAMRAADEITGQAVPHVHPRIDAGALCGLLAAAGFVNPVVDVDRVDVAYGSMNKLVADLRAMGATNVLVERSRRPLSRRAVAAAASHFEQQGSGDRFVEQFEILHFAAWTPADGR